MFVKWAVLCGGVECRVRWRYLGGDAWAEILVKGQVEGVAWGGG